MNTVNLQTTINNIVMRDERLSLKLDKNKVLDKDERPSGYDVVIRPVVAKEYGDPLHKEELETLINVLTGAERECLYDPTITAVVSKEPDGEYVVYYLTCHFETPPLAYKVAERFDSTEIYSREYKYGMDKNTFKVHIVMPFIDEVSKRMMNESREGWEELVECGEEEKEEE